MTLENNSTKQSQVEVIEKPKWGGARPGAGRPKGALTRLYAGDLLEELESVLGVPYATQLANNYLQVVYSDDTRLKAEYDRMFLSKVIADKVDITSNGQSIAPTILLDHAEIKDE